MTLIEQMNADFNGTLMTLIEQIYAEDFLMGADDADFGRWSQIFNGTLRQAQGSPQMTLIEQICTDFNGTQMTLIEQNCAEDFLMGPFDKLRGVRR